MRHLDLILITEAELYPDAKVPPPCYKGNTYGLYLKPGVLTEVLLIEELTPCRWLGAVVRQD